MLLLLLLFHLRFLHGSHVDSIDDKELKITGDEMTSSDTAFMHTFIRGSHLVKKLLKEKITRVYEVR